MKYGLVRKTVTLSNHNRLWHLEAQKIIRTIKKIMQDDMIDGQHIGSTSIKSIKAKPIVDVAIAVNKLNDAKKYIECLEKIKICYVREEEAEQLLFTTRNTEKNIVYSHIHVVEYNSNFWTDYVSFRDYLNTHPQRAKAYEQTKKELASKFPYDRDNYTFGKAELISQLLIEAKNWRTLHK